MKDKGVTMNRRGFLKGAAIAGGAVAVSTLGQSIAADTRDAETANRSDSKPKGYHVTPHILEYYEKARF